MRSVPDRPQAGVLLDRLRARVECGEIARAKELAAHYPHLVYDPVLWRTCGEVLLQTFDLELAGRFLFFAGSEAAEHREPIELYLRRSDRGRLQVDARRAGGLESLPASVQRELAARGVKSLPRRDPIGSDLGWRDVASVTAVVAILLLGVWKAVELIAALFA